MEMIDERKDDAGLRELKMTVKGGLSIKIHS